MVVFGNGAPHWMLPAGVALLTVILLRLALRRIAARRPSSTERVPAASARTSPGALRRGGELLPTELAEWQVEMHELARDLRGELDTKMRLLQLMLDQAQSEAARLEALLAQARSVQREPDRRVDPRGSTGTD